MSAFTGRDVIIEFAIGDEDSDPATLTFKRLGMMRGKGITGIHQNQLGDVQASGILG